VRHFLTIVGSTENTPDDESGWTLGVSDTDDESEEILPSSPSAHAPLRPEGSSEQSRNAGPTCESLYDTRDDLQEIFSFGDEAEIENSASMHKIDNNIVKKYASQAEDYWNKGPEMGEFPFYAYIGVVKRLSQKQTNADLGIFHIINPI
jgi:hypothetical protein